MHRCSKGDDNSIGIPDLWQASLTLAEEEDTFWRPLGLLTFKVTIKYHNQNVFYSSQLSWHTNVCFYNS